MDADFCAALWHALADPHIKRDVRPTPIVDQDPKGDVGFGLRIGLNVVFFPITDYQLFLNRPGAVLGTNYVSGHIVTADPPEGPQGFYFFIANRVGTQISRRLHSDQAIGRRENLFAASSSSWRKTSSVLSRRAKPTTFIPWGRSPSAAKLYRA